MANRFSALDPEPSPPQQREQQDQQQQQASRAQGGQGYDQRAYPPQRGVAEEIRVSLGSRLREVTEWAFGRERDLVCGRAVDAASEVISAQPQGDPAAWVPQVGERGETLRVPACWEGVACARSMHRPGSICEKEPCTSLYWHRIPSERRVAWGQGQFAEGAAPTSRRMGSPHRFGSASAQQVGRPTAIPDAVRHRHRGISPSAETPSSPAADGGGEWTPQMAAGQRRVFRQRMGSAGRDDAVARARLAASSGSAPGPPDVPAHPRAQYMEAIGALPTAHPAWDLLELPGGDRPGEIWYPLSWDQWQQSGYGRVRGWAQASEADQHHLSMVITAWYDEVDAIDAWGHSLYPSDIAARVEERVAERMHDGRAPPRWDALLAESVRGLGDVGLMRRTSGGNVSLVCMPDRSL